jgi:hypothetical protein
MTNPSNESLQKGLPHGTFLSEKITPKRRKILLRLSISAILSVSLLLAFFYYYLSPERVMARAIRKMTMVKSFDYQGDLALNFNGDFSKVSPLLPNSYFLKASLSGNADLRDEMVIKTFTDFLVTAQNLFPINFEVKSIGNTLFLNVKSIPDFGFNETGLFLNQWLEIKTEKFINQEDGVVSYEKLFGTMGKVQFLKELEPVEREKIIGPDAFHYKYEIDKESFLNFLERVISETYGQMDEGEQKTFAKIKDKVNFGKGEIWIDKGNGTFRRITFSLSLTGDSQTNQKVDVNGDINLKNIGHGGEVLEPANTKSIEEVLQLFQ